MLLSVKGTLVLGEKCVTEERGGSGEGINMGAYG